MRLVMWGTYDLSKPRTRILLKGLRRNGIQVDECHADVWRDIEDKSQIKGFAGRAATVLRWISSYPSLVIRYLLMPRHDAVFIGYLGLVDILVIWPLARLRGVPIVWDVFIPVYNMVVEDRRLVQPGRFLARILYVIEKFGASVADLVILDTKAHCSYFARFYGLPERKPLRVLVGAEDDVFRRCERRNWRNTNPDTVTVLFYGQFIPLHGVDTIIGAARLAAREDIDWVIVGSGQEAPQMRERLRDEPLPRLKWIPWAPYAELMQWIGRADICLGIFGATDKAARVIPNKVFQIIAAGAPLITRDSPAIRELLSDNMPGVYLVPPADPEAIVDAIHRFRGTRSSLQDVPLHCEATEKISPQAVTMPLVSQLQDLVLASKRRQQ